MLKHHLFLTFLLLHLITCDQINNHPTNALSVSQLQFENATGQGLTQQQLKFFIQFANYASQVYEDDIEKNTKYIKSRMDSLFGIPNYYFMVFIQTTPTRGRRYTFVNYDSVFAALTDINNYYPQWSYFFSRNFGSPQISDYSYISPGTRGKGITQQLQSAIRDLINQNPQDPQCLCPNTSLKSISQGLNDYKFGGWSIICAAEPVTYGLTLNYHDMWISTKERDCYYTIYTN